MHRKGKKAEGATDFVSAPSSAATACCCCSPPHIPSFYLLASPRCEALLGAWGSGASLGGATSPRGPEERESGATAERDEEVGLPLFPVAVEVILAFAML